MQAPKKPKDSHVHRNRKAVFGKTSPMKKARAIYQPVIIAGRTAITQAKARKQSLPEMLCSQLQQAQDYS